MTQKPSGQGPGGGTSSRFGDYLLVEKIAEGGMAELFLAKRTGVEGFEKVVAIKRILPEFSWNPDFVSMFVNEAKIAARLSHPNIVQIFDFGKIDNFYFIAMEYVAGKTLRDITRRSAERGIPVPVDIAAQLTARACAGLDHAHRKTDEQGRPLLIVHRDVSPQNILVSYEGEVKVVDFGIAKAVAEQSKATQGVLKGKLSYLSPELIRGEKIDARVDVFAMGLVFYELLTGKKLFPQSTPREVLDAITRVDSNEVARSVPNAPRSVREILRRGLAAQPAERFESAGAMQQALEEHLRSSGAALDARLIAGFMRLLFDESMGTKTAEMLRAEVIGSGTRSWMFPGAGPARAKGRGARMIAACGGALAGALTLVLVPPSTMLQATATQTTVTERKSDAVPPEAKPTAVPKAPAADAKPADKPLVAKADVPKPTAPPVPTAVPAPTAKPAPRPGEAALSRALAAVEDGEDTVAVREFETAFAQAPALREPNRAAYASVLAREAKRLFVANSPDAQRALRGAIDADPKGAESHFLLAKALAAANDREGAVGEYVEAVRLDPNLQDARFNLGVLYYRLGKYEEAIAQYRELLKLKPSYEADVYFNLSATLDRIGRREEARTVVRDGLKRSPGNELLEKQKARLGG